MKLGAIIRSCGERTETLCLSSLKRELPKRDIIVVKNIHPFRETLFRCYYEADRRPFDWYLCVDADMIMVKGWKTVLMRCLDTLKHIPDSYKIWELNFKLRDVVDPNPIGDLRVINNKYSVQLMYSYRQIRDSVKPEAAICANIIKRLNVRRVVSKDIIAYHGFEQYRRDVFNRFYIRACRDTSYVNRRHLFIRKPLSPTEEVAQAGWDYGIKHREAKSLDFKKKIDIPKELKIKELPPLKTDLEEFYKSVGGL